MDLKTHFRSEIKNKIRAYSLEKMHSNSESIVHYLRKLLNPFSGLWSAFRPLKSEPQIDFLTALPFQKWAFPQTESQQLTFKTNVMKWETSSFGVQEPLDGTSAALSDFEGFVIPCLGLHQDGYRLGRGAGFYDRTFGSSNLLTNKYKIGLCFADAISADIPYESHDLKLDIGVSEQGIYFFNQKIKKVFTGE